MSDTSALWAGLIGTVVGGAIAVLGGVVTEKMARSREARGRIDAHRIDTYVSALKWAIDTLHSTDHQLHRLANWEPERLESLLPPSDLEARMAAFADLNVSAKFSLAAAPIKYLSEKREDPSQADWADSDFGRVLSKFHTTTLESVYGLDHQLEELRDSVRRQLDLLSK